MTSGQGPSRGRTTAEIARRSRVLALSLVAWAAAFAACDRNREERTVENAEPTFAAQAAAPVTTANPAAREQLPRQVGSVTLRMKRSEVEGAIGPLGCHENAEGFEVCRPENAERSERGLEVFLYNNEVVSLAYEVPPPEEVWSYLEALTGRFGEPALKGMTERDRNGRLHELYGWRDPRSLYSVRFIWQESPTRKLSGAAITLWDRQAYAAWENGRQTAPADAGPTPDLT